MDRINGANTIDIGGGRRGWRKQNAAAGVSGTEFDPLWFNALQEEVMAVIAAGGLAPEALTWTQLRDAIAAMITAALPSLAGYVAKAGDTMTGRLAAPGFRANKGYSTNTGSAGFAFGVDGDTGLFADGTGADDTSLVSIRINALDRVWVNADGRLGCAADPVNDYDVVRLGYLLAHGRGMIGMRTITASGTYTKTTGTNRALVIATGGGAAGGYDATGGGSAWAGGGGAGATAISLVDLSAVSTVACVIGAGGTGYTGWIGNNGGATSFGALLAAGGGAGGGITGGGIRFGGQGGTATVGDWLLGGGGGGAGSVAAMGGASFWGGGGAEGAAYVAASADGRAPGSGGAGGAAGYGANGDGADGAIFILEFA
jgi:hypothetical protein